MCGIVGFINNDPATAFGAKARTVFEQLLWHSTQRGPNGTGVLAVNGGPGAYQTTMYKNAMWAPEYLDYHTYRTMIQRRLELSKAAIGHNRATTRGSVRNENAHPFEHKHITLVQNGFIAEPNKHLGKGVSHEVDSYTAAWLMAEKGEKEALELMDWGGVFVWWNHEKNTLNMARNIHRELWCVGVKGHNAMFYASEWQMLHWILTRNELEPETKYLLLSPNVWFQFDPTKPKEWVKTPFVDPPLPKSQNRHGRRMVPAVGGSGNQPATGGNTKNTASDTVSPKRPDQITETELIQYERQFDRFSSKEKHKFGIPESRHKLRKVCAKIENTGISQARFGQKFVIYPSAWIPYKNQKALGAITGSKRADADIYVEIPNTTKADYDRLSSSKYTFATVVNTKKSKSGNWILVMALIPELPPTAPVEGVGKSFTKTDGTQATIVKGPRGSYIELARFQQMVQGGCGECTGFVNPNYAEDIAWFGDEPICHICVADPAVQLKLGFDTSKVSVRH